MYDTTIYPGSHLEAGWCDCGSAGGIEVTAAAVTVAQTIAALFIEF